MGRISLYSLGCSSCVDQLGLKGTGARTNWPSCPDFCVVCMLYNHHYSSSICYSSNSLIVIPHNVAVPTLHMPRIFSVILSTVDHPVQGLFYN